MNHPLLSRRRFLGAAAWGLGAGSFFTVPGLFAQELSRTPPMMEGPFYPYHNMPLDTDNDLIIINDSITPAVGEITNLTGRVLGVNGQPIRNASIEIWQCDSRAVYLAGDAPPGVPRQGDAHFQGFGRFTTAANGEYRFRTIKPVSYPGRTPHIHFKVKQGERTLLTTQLFISGHPQNVRDDIFLGLRGAPARELVCTHFNPVPGSRTGELSARWDIVIGLTPGE